MAGIRRSYAGYYEVVMNGEVMIVTKKILQGLREGESVSLPSESLKERSDYIYSQEAINLVQGNK